MKSNQLMLGQFLDRARDMFPYREIISGLGQSPPARFTITDYASRVDRLCWGLRDLGVTPGDRVATLAWNDHRHLELYMAVPMSGAVLHTINLRLSVSQIVEIMVHAGDRVLFVDASLAEIASEAAKSVPSLARVVVLGELASDAAPGWLAYDALLSEQPDDRFEDFRSVPEDAPAAMCYSSATTGRPKGVIYSHRALYLHSAMLAMADTWALSHHDTVLPIVPMFHVNAWGIPFTALWMGAKIVLPGPRPSAKALVGLMVEEGITFSAAVPTVWMDVMEIIRREGRSLPRMRMMVSGGGALPGGLLDLADELGLPMTHSYGMTEASPLTHVNRAKVPPGDGPESPDTARSRRLRQGLLVPGLSMRLQATDGAEVPRDGSTPGELQLRGPWVAESYADDARSAASFRDGWYRTGDIATIDAEGYVLIVDRKQDLIKSGGEWISSIQLEGVASAHRDVLRAAAVGVPHPRWQERPVLFVEPHPGTAVDEKDLRAWLTERVPRWWIPELIESLEELPVTTVGKIDKVALRRRLEVGLGRPVQPEETDTGPAAPSP